MTQSTYPLIDIGANLCDKSFHTDIDDVLERAQESGIIKLLVTGTDANISEQALELSKKYPELLSCTAGVHPHYADNYNHDVHQSIAQLARNPEVKAIGETGLDFNRNFSSPANQIKAFEQQIELAAETGLPLFIHERDAHQQLFDIIKNHRDDISQAVVHCFTGEKRTAFNYLDLDLHIGITGWICDERRGHHLHEFVGDIPLNRLLLETDAPYLLPRVKPKLKMPKSNRNEPSTLGIVLVEVAKHRSESAEVIAEQTTANAKALFKLS